MYRFKIKFEEKVERKKIQHTKLQQSFDDKVDEVGGKKNVSHGFSSVFVRSNSYQFKIQIINTLFSCRLLHFWQYQIELLGILL